MNPRKTWICAGLFLVASCLGVQTDWALAQDTRELNTILGHMKSEGRVFVRKRALVSNSVNGLLSKIHFSQGDVVEQGQLLFELNDASYRLQVQAASAVVERRQVELEMAASNAKRLENLYSRDATSASAREDSLQSLAMARANLAEAEARLAHYQLLLSATSISAPISGVITGASVSIGAFLEAKGGVPLAEIVELDPILVSFKQPYDRLLDLHKAAPASLRELFEKMEVTITLPTGEVLSRKGKPIYSAVSLDEDDGSLMVWAEIPNPDLMLVPGLKVQVEVRIVD